MSGEIINTGAVGSTLYSKGTHNGTPSLLLMPKVGSTLYSKGTHNLSLMALSSSRVGSTLYSKGTHNMILDWWLGRWNVQ